MAAAPKTKGLKRICADCGTRFYDFEKRPINCPNCAVEFTGEIKVRTRRSRAAVVSDTPAAETAVEAVAETTEAETSDDEQEEDDGVEVVSLEDMKSTEGATDEDDKGASIDLDADGDITDLDELDAGDLDADAEDEGDDEEKDA